MPAQPNDEPVPHNETSEETTEEITEETKDKTTDQITEEPTEKTTEEMTEETKERTERTEEPKQETKEIDLDTRDTEKTDDTGKSIDEFVPSDSINEEKVFFPFTTFLQVSRLCT